MQMLAIVRNRTEIEDWILEKARYRQDDKDTKYVHPYSKGWRFNISQVLTWDCTPVGDGIMWPIIDGCDQYTLTVYIYIYHFIMKIIIYCNNYQSNKKYL